VLSDSCALPFTVVLTRFDYIKTAAKRSFPITDPQTIHLPDHDMQLIDGLLHVWIADTDASGGFAETTRYCVRHCAMTIGNLSNNI